MIEERNIYEGVTWVPLRESFVVTIPDGWRKRLVGYFPTLESAVSAREKAEIRFSGGKQHEEAQQ